MKKILSVLLSFVLSFICFLPVSASIMRDDKYDANNDVLSIVITRYSMPSSSEGDIVAIPKGEITFATEQEKTYTLHLSEKTFKLGNSLEYSDEAGALFIKSFTENDYVTDRKGNRYSLHKIEAMDPLTGMVPSVPDDTEEQNEPVREVFTRKYELVPTKYETGSVLFVRGFVNGEDTVEEGKTTQLAFELRSGTIENNKEYIFDKTDPVLAEKLSWSSQNNDIATVNENGVVKGIKEGKTFITANYDGLEISHEITVTKADIVNPPQEEDKEDEIVRIHGISVDAPRNTLMVGKTMTLYACEWESETNKTSNTSSYNEKTVVPTWSSSSKKIATISKNGTVKGIRPGTVTLTATYKGQTEKVKITVWKVKKVKVSGKSTVKKGKSIQLKAKVSCTKGGKSKGVTWKSSNKKIATVSKNGKVKGKKKGKVTIKAYSKDNKKVVGSKKIKVK